MNCSVSHRRRPAPLNFFPLLSACRVFPSVSTEQENPYLMLRLRLLGHETVSLSLPDRPHFLAVYFSVFLFFKGKMMEDMRELEEEEDKTHKCTHTKEKFHLTHDRSAPSLSLCKGAGCRYVELRHCQHHLSLQVEKLMSTEGKQNQKSKRGSEKIRRAQSFSFHVHSRTFGVRRENAERINISSTELHNSLQPLTEKDIFLFYFLFFVCVCVHSKAP